MKLLRVVGARPQFMQAAVLRKELEKKNHTEVLVHTGQHYDKNMSENFFKELDLPLPDYNLNVGTGSHGTQTSKMLSGIEEILMKEKPDAVVVDGDTNSTLAGALAASKLHIPIVHVEAGLRSFNRKMPEEINRVVTDHLSSLLCAPTQKAVENLNNEGLSQKCVHTGDLMYDCFQQYVNKADTSILERLSIKPKKYILCTVHRAENTNDQDAMINILDALNQMPEMIIFPCHPRTMSYLKDNYSLNFSAYSNIKFTCPAKYLEMIALENNARTIITDSGGVQREAYFAKVPSVIVRNETEWVEQVEAGWSFIGKTKSSTILEAFKKIDHSQKNNPSIYGEGNASKNVVEAIERSIS